jgi:CubicO group peptidase (beta-lactamase class C family)
MPRGSSTRSRSTSGSGRPAARATRTPRTLAPTWYSHRFPGWYASGTVASRRSHSSGGGRLLAEDTVRAMLTEQAGPVDDEGGGWGLGTGVRRTDEPGGRSAGSFGWDGGLGGSWWTDPVTGTTAVLLTNQAWSSPAPPAVFDGFRAAAFGPR